MFKIIKNSKLFGIFNLLDMVIIFLVLLLFLPILHYYIKFNEKGIADQRNLEKIVGKEGWEISRTATIEVYVTFKDIAEDVLNKIKVGDKEVLPDGTAIAEVLWLGESHPHYFVTNLGIQAMPAKKLYSLPAKLRLRGIVDKTKNFVYKSRNIDNRSNYFTIDTANYKADYEIDVFSKSQTVTVDLYASFKNLTKETLNKIKVGDKEVLPDGTISSEILWLGEPEPNYFMTTLVMAGKGSIPAVQSGEFYSLPAKLRLRGIVIENGDFIYKMVAIRDNASYVFDSGNYKADFAIESQLFNRLFNSSTKQNSR